MLKTILHKELIIRPAPIPIKGMPKIISKGLFLDWKIKKPAKPIRKKGKEYKRFFALINKIVNK